MVIGLDGGTWDVFDRMIDLSLMPNLEKLCKSGYRSKLISTTPILTPTAWTTFATGVNPGKHGVLGFMAPQEAPGQYSPPLPRRTTIARKTLWRRLSQNGLKSIVLSVPLTYPPEQIKGSIVTGMFTPDSNCDCTWPGSLKKELMDENCMPDFDILLPDSSGKSELNERDYVEFFKNIEQFTDKLHRAGMHMMKKSWDFFMTMFLSNDRFQHALWDKIIRLDESGNDFISQKIRAFYARLDEIIGQMLKAAGDDCICLIMSDHGFGPCHGRFNLGPWFAKNGYLEYQSNKNYKFLKKIAERLGLKKLLKKSLSTKQLARLISQTIPLNWQKTKAYPTVGGIQINLKGREKYGIVDPANYHALRDELREKLSELTDPSGRKVFSRLCYPEEIYHGDYTQYARDIIMQISDDPSYEFFIGSSDSPTVEPRLHYRGNHRPDGIFIAYGSGVARNPNAQPANIADLGPTILWLMGLDIPAEMDGRVIQQAFDFVPQPFCATESSPPTTNNVSSTSDRDTDEDQHIIQQRLKNIGYLE